MLRSPAQEVAAERIRVNAIAPGAIHADQQEHLGDGEGGQTARPRTSPQPQCGSQAMIRTMSSVRPSLSMAA